MVNGVQFTPQDGIARMIPLINFEKDIDKNIFRVVNQFIVEYTNNGQKVNRRPDVILFDKWYAFMHCRVKESC